MHNELQHVSFGPSLVLSEPSWELILSPAAKILVLLCWKNALAYWGCFHLWDTPSTTAHQANQQSEHLGEFSLQGKHSFKITLMSIANFILGWKLRFPNGNKKTFLCLPWNITFYLKIYIRQFGFLLLW